MSSLVKNIFDSSITADADGDVSITGSVYVKEKADAGSDVAGQGQLWVDNQTPCELYFTTDAGNDIQITSGTGLAGSGSSVSLANGVDNRIATATGASALNGEANLTFDGNTLTLTDAVSDTSAGTFIAVDVNFDKTGNSTSDNTMIGINLDMDNTSATGGNNEMVGIKVTPTLTHASGTGTATCKGLEIVATGATATPQQETVRAIDIIATGAETNQGIFMKVDNGTGPDIKMVSSANNADSCTLTTSANGEFTIKTTDADAALAHINLEPDGDVIIKGTNPKLTIGDAGAEDTMLAFDGNAADFRIGIDDGTDTLEIGKGTAHGTDAVIKIKSTTNLELLLNSGVADGEYSGTVALFTAAEDLTAGEVVYLNSSGKMAKAVATAAATSRAVPYSGTAFLSC